MMWYNFTNRWGIARLEQAYKLSDFVRELTIKNITKDKKLSRKQMMFELQKRSKKLSATDHLSQVIKGRFYTDKELQEFRALDVKETRELRKRKLLSK